ncbi:GntR family transcriptional regulator [Noviherbaspirillum saxi]|uniref:GntR family transcriptional regulator n=1 Tax=Noviherbaspirillum saxi TaxID=2320863 RepID=A0A3A3FNF8_9BURK|nr:GntR family transcriptional regulator [Noviherbaspirillum saxi]RJF97433.1 GntR family transcriptional regulator [Noviherbaspirillum saxi]
MKSTTDKTERRSPLQLELAERIGRQIASGELAAGTHLTEETFAASFEVSRTPIRAALQLLAEHELSEYRPNAGYFVRADAAHKELPDFSGTGMTSDALYRTLIDDRAQKRLPEALTEKELLSRYPVSRSLLAKTLMKMSVDDLIEKRKGHGWRFTPSLDTPEAISESYRFRILFECAGMLEPTFQVDQAQLQRSREAHEKLLQKAEGQLSASEFFALNASFHEMLARFSGNRFILQAMQQQNQLRRMEEHADFFRLGRFSESCSEHLQIISALENNDPEWASALMRRHLATAMPKTKD